MSDSKRPIYDSTPLGPLPPVASPRHPQPDENEPRTDPGLPVSAGYVRAKLEQVRAESQKQIWASGWIAGIGSSILMVSLAFAVWFKSDANAQEKADKAMAHAVEIADAGVEKKLAPIITDIAVLKSHLEALEASQARSETKQDEMIRLLKARR